MGEVADLFATLGLKVNQGEWARGDSAIARARAAADELGRRFIGAGNALRGVTPAAKEAGAAAEDAGNRAARSFDAAGAAIKGYLAYLAGHAAYDKLIASNQEFEDRTIGMAAMIEGNLGGSFKAAREQAEGLNVEFQRFDQSGAPATLAEIAEFGKNVAAATFSAGGKIKELTQITEQGVIAAKVLAGNRGAGYASLEISEMLMGNVSNRMMMVRQLLAMIHMTEDQFRALDAPGRLKATLQALNSPGMKDAGDAFKSSFSGIETTIESKFQILGRKIGEPLFGRLKEEGKGFIGWLDDHSEDIERIGTAIGDFLVDAFEGLSFAIQKVVEYGGEVLDWLGQFVDGGELVKSFLIAIGALLTAFAIESAVAFATNPITLLVLGVTALIYAIRKLMAYPGGIKQAFADAWAAIKRGAEALGKAIEDALSAAFDFVAELPVIKQLLALMRWADGHSGLNHNAAHDKMTQEQIDQLPDDQLDYVERMSRLSRPDQFVLPASAGGSGPVAINVDASGMTVNAPNADPKAVADHVNATIGEHLANSYRRAMDRVG